MCNVGWDRYVIMLLILSRFRNVGEFRWQISSRMTLATSCSISPARTKCRLLRKNLELTVGGLPWSDVPWNGCVRDFQAPSVRGTRLIGIIVTIQVTCGCFNGNKDDKPMRPGEQRAKRLSGIVFQTLREPDTGTTNIWWNIRKPWYLRKKLLFNSCT